MEIPEQIGTEENTPSQASSRKRYLTIGIVVILVVVIGVGALLYGSLKPEGEIPQITPNPSDRVVVSIEDQTCIVDSDCTIVGTLCSTCECGVPVNKVHEQKYIDQYGDLCQDYQGPACDFLCETPFIRCVDNQCVLSTEPPDLIDTSNWQTYRNKEFGFEVKYPEEWEIREFEPKIDIGVFRLPEYYAVSVSKIENPEGLNGKQYAEQWLKGIRSTLSEYTVISKSTEVINVGGYSGYRVRGFHTGIQGEPNLDVNFVVLPDQELIYQIQFPIGEGQLGDDIIDPEKNYKFADQILSTFRFIEPNATSGANCLNNYEYYITPFANPWPDPCISGSFKLNVHVTFWIRSVNQDSEISGFGPTITFTLLKPDSTRVEQTKALNYFTVPSCLPGAQCPNGSWNHTFIDFFPENVLDQKGEYTLTASDPTIKDYSFRVTDL